MQTYEHRQLSPWLLLAFVLILVAFAFFGNSGVGQLEKLAAFVLVSLLTLAFASLCTRVDAGGVSWTYTWGFPGGSIPFSDIAEVQMTRTSWWEGFGIHWSLWHGWLWNVWGHAAVSIRKRNGALITLGTDDPQGLYDAIARLGPHSGAAMTS